MSIRREARKKRYAEEKKPRNLKKETKNDEKQVNVVDFEVNDVYHRPDVADLDDEEAILLLM